MDLQVELEDTCVESCTADVVVQAWVSNHGPSEVYRRLTVSATVPATGEVLAQAFLDGVLPAGVSRAVELRFPAVRLREGPVVSVADPGGLVTCAAWPGPVPILDGTCGGGS